MYNCAFEYTGNGDPQYSRERILKRVITCVLTPHLVITSHVRDMSYVSNNRVVNVHQLLIY